MNLTVWLAGVLIASLLACACLAAILIYFSPADSNAFVFILFYLSLFIAVGGFFTLIGFAIRRLSQKKVARLLARQLESSFRQGILLAIIITLVLVFQGQKILAWWNLSGLLVLIGLIEWRLSRR